MPFELDVRHENLSYTGNFAYPPLALWGAGGKIVRGLYDALAPHGVTLQHIQIHAGTSNAAENIVTVTVPNFGFVKFGFARIEANFSNLTTEFVGLVPEILRGATAWVRKDIPDFGFSSHKASYFTHAFVKDSTPEAVLKTISSGVLRSSGINLGTGAIFNCSVPAKKWQTQLVLDRSQLVPGALYISLAISVGLGEIAYDKLIVEGTIYLREALAELDLRFPEVG